jgi:hypothetical protein
METLRPLLFLSLLSACNCPANAHVPVERNLTCNNPQGLCECPQGYEHHKGREVCIDERAKVLVGNRGDILDCINRQLAC